MFGLRAEPDRLWIIRWKSAGGGEEGKWLIENGMEEISEGAHRFSTAGTN